ncbi:AMP-binding protein [Flavihumibacter stibioxidans]|uniref:AMP-binding protein n=2 Tax=Flavihumibacter stibioxidans TaxID=1834163 RepID=A0ABR7MAN2_9BACT|nr:AMP-binding protein [Flavihumibacter stibioxidans]
MIQLPTSLVDILRWRAKHQPDRLAYRYLQNGEREEIILNYVELDKRARAIGALLQANTRPKERALLLLPPGPDFIAAFWGCLYARVIAIPAYPLHPARLEKMLPNILRIISDATPAVALLTTSLFDAVQTSDICRDKFADIKLLPTDHPDKTSLAEKWQEQLIDPNELAFLQYTSGSTFSPKGVMVNHRNLIHNLGQIEKHFGQSSESHAVIWLPPYHDMGLVGGILQPLYSGYPSTLIPYTLFLQQPFRWLDAISHFRGTTSGGPNFAYELCLRKIKPEQREQLDLSSWEVAFNGAEPIHQNTIQRFAEYFSPSGFHQNSFLPCYGLAEATLMVSGGPKKRSLQVRKLSRTALERDHSISSPASMEDEWKIVGCGQVPLEQQVIVVNTETLSPCPRGQVGEIWVSGPNIAPGYWNNPAATNESFGAKLSLNSDRTYLRTGDAGFLDDGELFITGRLKNLIIISGKNHYANDIEQTASNSHPAIMPSGLAAFSVQEDDGEKLIIIAEIHRDQDLCKKEEITKAIKTAVSTCHDLQVHDIKITCAGSIPRTTSGKIRHFICRKQYLADALNPLNPT